MQPYEYEVEDIKVTIIWEVGDTRITGFTPEEIQYLRGLKEKYSKQ